MIHILLLPEGNLMVKIVVAS